MAAEILWKIHYIHEHHHQTQSHAADKTAASTVIDPSLVRGGDHLSNVAHASSIHSGIKEISQGGINTSGSYFPIPPIPPPHTTTQHHGAELVHGAEASYSAAMVGAKATAGVAANTHALSQGVLYL